MIHKLFFKASTSRFAIDYGSKIAACEHLLYNVQHPCQDVLGIKHWLLDSHLIPKSTSMETLSKDYSLVVVVTKCGRTLHPVSKKSKQLLSCAESAAMMKAGSFVMALKSTKPHLRVNLIDASMA